MIFKIGDSVAGKESTPLEYGTGVVVDTDTDENMVCVNIETHEFEEEAIGEQEWYDVDDMRLLTASGATSFTGIPVEQADLTKLVSVSEMDFIPIRNYLNF